MPRFWVMTRGWAIGLVVLLAIDAVALLVGGIASGGWMYGILFSCGIMFATFDWWRLRSTDLDARTVADRMAMSVLFLAVGASLPGLTAIDDLLGKIGQ